ncbi:aldehyde dehydrogenase, dimeric NADP-preferring [Tribolium castaneum]|uniref:Aldehyde dehydrogenase n=1 Tax=Tribolium castaneum TaxID=7070 RepID=A0A139WDD8_TRICA|nr:PREDICTED: aldehyde dehydrogenase, dimeric NADP-preferring [Tribolium castaneum]KYB25924.1 Aldehyde dehydrogenase, dimeric NADP-preferring-like Protein [Tribolium castaneum]|eukprot:XP_008197104.1 PREDICTED: aldehyde dehydrogenase, dimeric NADP-preferring [Tribolium castaneum]
MYSRTGETVVDITTPPDPAKIVHIARDRFEEGKTKPIKFRKKQLNNLVKFVQDNEDAILEALYQDFRKPKQEVVCYEIVPVVKEAKHAINHLEEWAKPEKPKKSLVNLLDGVMVYNDPFGVVLVMGAWNYPLALVLMPVIGAIAAGNCVVIKPSDLSPATSQLMYKLLPNYLDPECYPVYQGGVKETTELLKEKFDYIFYTGSTSVGQIVHKAANRHLTPVTLELGGKSPAYIDNSADITKTVKRILWGKCINSGQTCIAPDYILCTKEVQDKFVKYAEKALLEFYGSDIKDSNDYSRIITDRHFERLVNLLPGLKIAVGGRYEQKDRFIEPTIAIDVNPNHAIMQEEIFGPILPIIPINNIDEAITFINRRNKPLALYIFSTRKQDREKLLSKTSSGGVCVNDTILHASVDVLPFGGVGTSGMGSYHGKKTFDTFTHKKSVLVRDFQAIPEKIMASRYPPYSNSKISLIQMALEERKRVPLKYLPHFVMFLLGVGITIAVYFLYLYLEV